MQSSHTARAADCRLGLHQDQEPGFARPAARVLAALRAAPPTQPYSTSRRRHTLRPMLMTADAGPYAFDVQPGVRYRRLSGRPPWEADLHLDLLIPRTPTGHRSPVVVYFHSGGWASGGRELGMYPWINPLLASHGFLTASVSYRLSTRAPFPAQIEDARTALAWMRANAAQYLADPDRIGVWGDSAGGHLTLLLGTQHTESAGVRAVVARCSPSDFRAWHMDDEDEPGSIFYQLFGGRNSHLDQLRLAASPVAHLRSQTTYPPFLLWHGDADETVPYEQSVAFVQLLRSAGGTAHLVTVRGGYHNMTTDEFAPWTDEPWAELGRKALTFFLDHIG
jgi:acetyl esterase/lipase